MFDKKHFLQRLFQLLSIKSISADPAYKSEMNRAVTFLKQELVSAGFFPKKIETLYARGLSLKTNSPVLYAERLDTSGAPTVLIYGHYDVQPPDPLELWKSLPFKPEVRSGKIFARGATDDKGQVYTHLAAFQVLSKTWGKKWPINVKILIEGEEESGGQNIEKLLRQKPKKFKADVCLVSDTGFVAKGKPALEVGLRGIIYFELKVTTGKKDLHSGLYGGAAHNPLNILSRVMSEIGGKIGKTLRKESENARYSSFDVHGFTGGFQGEGAKTVIPNKAAAKFSIRLVAGQKPENIVAEIKSLVEKRIPKRAKAHLKVLGSGEAFLLKGESLYLKLAKASLKKVFGKSPVLMRGGGSIPIVSTIANVIGAEVVLMGYGLPDDNLHAPNEKFDLKQFYKGIECNIEFLTQVAGLK